MTKLSVVIPVRNVAPYFPALAQSLCRNLHRDFEFILVDDASTDHTPELIREYRERLPGLVVLRNETPVGLADARNQGLAASSGEYLSFADGDDWLLGGYLEQLVAAITDLNVDFVRVDHIRATGKQRRLVRAPMGQRNTKLDPAKVIAPASRPTLVDYCTAWAGIYRRKLYTEGLLEFPSGLHTAEDRPWIWRLHLAAESCAVVSLAGYFYRRQVAGSLTAIGDARQLHYLKAFSQVMDLVSDQATPIKEKAMRGYLAVIAHQLKSEGRFPPALRREHRREVRTALTALDPAGLAEILPQLGRDRQTRIARAQQRPVWCPL